MDGEDLLLQKGLYLFQNLLIQLAGQFIRAVGYVVHTHLGTPVHPRVGHIVSDITGTLFVY